MEYSEFRKTCQNAVARAMYRGKGRDGAFDELSSVAAEYYLTVAEEILVSLDKVANVTHIVVEPAPETIPTLERSFSSSSKTILPEPH